jgi:hypothetical protein
MAVKGHVQTIDGTVMGPVQYSHKPYYMMMARSPNINYNAALHNFFTE